MKLDLYSCNNIHSQSRTQPAAKGHRVHPSSWHPLYSEPMRARHALYGKAADTTTSVVLCRQIHTLVNTSTWGKNYNRLYWYIFIPRTLKKGIYLKNQFTFFLYYIIHYKIFLISHKATFCAIIVEILSFKFQTHFYFDTLKLWFIFSKCYSIQAFVLLFPDLRL